jgi:uncharacterized membrane protein YgdD (TMEM256/DUF423 family)
LVNHFCNLALTKHQGFFMNKKMVITAAILICLSIGLGAFAAHGLKSIVASTEITIFEKGVKYQMYTGISLLVIGLAADKFKFDLKLFHRLSVLGIIIFSGFLYLLTFKEMYYSIRIVGAIVPVGGTLMISAWIVLIIQLMKHQD